MRHRRRVDVDRADPIRRSPPPVSVPASHPPQKPITRPQIQDSRRCVPDLGTILTVGRVLLPDMADMVGALGLRASWGRTVDVIVHQARRPPCRVCWVRASFLRCRNGAWQRTADAVRLCHSLSKLHDIITAFPASNWGVGTSKASAPSALRLDRRSGCSTVLFLVSSENRLLLAQRLSRWAQHC